MGIGQKKFDLTNHTKKNRMPDIMISEHLQRFILTSIESVPHLEAILLLKYNANKEWTADEVAESLFIKEKNAQKILADLHAVKLIDCSDKIYFYNPVSPELKERIDELAGTYAKHLIEVTNLIHSKTSKQAQQFGDGFTW